MHAEQYKDGGGIFETVIPIKEILSNRWTIALTALFIAVNLGCVSVFSAGVKDSSSHFSVITTPSSIIFFNAGPCEPNYHFSTSTLFGRHYSVFQMNFRQLTSLGYSGIEACTPSVYG